MAAMNEALQEFVASNPHFFEKKGDLYFLRPDIYDLVEEYARLVDVEEYDRVRKLVDSIRKDNWEYLEEEIREREVEIQRYRSEIPAITARIEDCDEALHKLECRIAALRDELAEMSIDYVPWYCSSIVFWLMAASGIACMYVGIFITARGVAGFLPLGLVFLIVGVLLQSRQTLPQQPGGHRVESNQQASHQLKSEVRLLKIKRATYLQQKSVAKQAIEGLVIAIRNIKQKKRILNG
jgi:hypothetical protein